jgi:hypothetical protein
MTTEDLVHEIYIKAPEGAWRATYAGIFTVPRLWATILRGGIVAICAIRSAKGLRQKYWRIASAGTKCTTRTAFGDRMRLHGTAV